MNIAELTVEKTDTFLENLRAHTSESHRKLESLPISGSIISSEITNEQYGLYLNLMADVVKDTEELVFPILKNTIPDLEERRKLQLLKQDLATLNHQKKSNSSVFESDYSVPFALGILYVVEGSTLGGRFILKNIHSVLGFDERNGASYFAGYGNKTGSSWKNFLNVLVDFEQENNCGLEIIAGADFAFNAIYKHLGNPHHEN